MGNKYKKNICLLCNKEKITESHHLSYKQKITTELCRSCHIKMHSLLNKKKKTIIVKCPLCNKKWGTKEIIIKVKCPGCLIKIKNGK